MARRSRKKRIHHAHEPSGETGVAKLPVGLLVSLLITAICAGIPFGIGKYIELNSPGPFDSGAYVYSAQHLLDGAKMYVDENPSARPGTLIANLLGVKLFGFNDTGPKIVQMVLQLAALVFMFVTLRKAFGQCASVIGTTIAALYLSAPLIAKFGNVKEQFMIAFMIYAACAFTWYAVTQKRHWLILSGFFALQPYYFKPTGMSVVFAIVLYILIGNAVSRQWKTAWRELALFLSGYAAGMMVPGWLFLWQDCLMRLLKTFPPIAVALGAGVLVLTSLPQVFQHLAAKKNIEAVKKLPQWIWALGILAIIAVAAVTQWDRILSAAGLKGGYLSGSQGAKSWSDIAPQIFRYYKALSVPILAAIFSMILAIIVGTVTAVKKRKPAAVQSKLVWMLAAWWILDAAFVWISPRSYEQYYLPLCASAAMLSGYGIWAWTQKLKTAAVKIPWLLGGGVCVIVLASLTIPIFIGQRYSPDTGADYTQNNGTRRRGFGPALKELPYRKKGSWAVTGDYIRAHSAKTDGLYVWGWVPGIYVQAQRLAPVNKAFESDMHVKAPLQLQREIVFMLRQLEETPPKFIVDSRKQHFPNDRPPLELWPTVPAKVFGNKTPRLLGKNPAEVAAFDTFWKKVLENQIEPDEAKRYEAMKPLREFVMSRYKVVNRREFGRHVVFERID